MRDTEGGKSKNKNRRTGHRNQTEQLPIFPFLLDGDTKRPEASTSESLSLGAIIGSDLFVEFVKSQDRIWSAFRTAVSFTFSILDFGSNALRDRIERGELVSLPTSFEDFLSLGIIFERSNRNFVNRVERLDIVRGAQYCYSHEPVHVDSLSNERLVEGKFVGGELESISTGYRESVAIPVCGDQ